MYLLTNNMSHVDNLKLKMVKPYATQHFCVKLFHLVLPATRDIFREVLH